MFDTAADGECAGPRVQHREPPRQDECVSHHKQRAVYSQDECVNHHKQRAVYITMASATRSARQRRFEEATVVSPRTRARARADYLNRCAVRLRTVA